MGLISALIKAGLVAGASITAYQASEKTRQEGAGQVKADDFVRNFKDLAVANSKLVVDTVKAKVGKSEGGYRYSDKGENGYTYAETKPDGDKVDEVFESMKEKAPEVIDKVQDFVEEVRDRAPEYIEKAQDILSNVKDAAEDAIKKARDKDE